MATPTRTVQEGGEGVKDSFRSFALILLAVWGSVAVAISVGLYFTRDIRCLFFFIIPLLKNMSIQRGEK